MPVAPELVRDLLVGLLVAARVLGAVLTAPVWSTPGLSWHLRLMLTAGLALVVAPIVGPGLAPPEGAVALARCGLGELAVGAGLGLSLGLVVAAARLAGDLIGAQAGLSAASLLDPEALDAGEVTPLGHLHALIAMGVFLALDGPLRLLEAVIGSYRAFPAGGLTLDRALVARAFGRVDEALALALSAAAPVALALVTAGLALGLLARAASGVQVLALALSVRWLLAIVLVALLLGLLAGQFTGAWTTALAALSAAGPAAGGPR